MNWCLTHLVGEDGTGKLKRSGYTASLICFRLDMVINGIIKV